MSLDTYGGWHATRSKLAITKVAGAHPQAIGDVVVAIAELSEKIGILGIQKALISNGEASSWQARTASGGEWSNWCAVKAEIVESPCQPGRLREMTLKL